MIDLRSDTVTRPTPAMRQAMAAAEVGDDVFGEDPTVRALERRVADLLGKDAAIFMPSGTMTNQVAIRCQTEHGDSIVCGATAHIFRYEGGAPAALSGVLCRLMPDPEGTFTPADLSSVLSRRDPHVAPPVLLCLENTHNFAGGRVWPADLVADLAARARDAGLRVHLDGARLWNAAVYLGVPEAELARPFDSVSVCFSKGLGAPVGSALAGSAALVERARRFRKQFGGGMRQAGIVAAGALYALDHHRPRLADDHALARRLADGLARLPGVLVDPARVQTNIVLFTVKGLPAAEVVERLAAAGVGLLALAADRVRAVTHLQVDAPQIDAAVAAVDHIRPR